MSRTLQNSELRYRAVEKEATAIEAVCQWSYFLVRHPFSSITHQCSVAFMLDNCRQSEEQQTRMELFPFSYSMI